ncbi:hypothetical protein POTOM_038358 [Populus tomentosa]|uniref:Uncharacterized protein n=1 Tax=Populus tomentosa TaxID=118781 RepID=A0A8X7YX85_POPTO|nr:hypothetical protein POTOM_038358 [Populus tomentosa]
MLLVIWNSSRAQPSSIRTSFSCCIQCFYLLVSLLGGKGLLALVFDLRLHIPSQHACSLFQDPSDGSTVVRGKYLYRILARIMMDSNIQEKVHKVEEFFDGHLKPQLVRAIAERDKVFEQQKMLYPFLFIHGSLEIK